MQVFRNFRNMKNIIKSKMVSINVNRIGTNMHNFQTCPIADLHHVITLILVTHGETIKIVRDVVVVPVSLYQLGSTLYELVDAKAAEGCSSWNDSSILYQHLTAVWPTLPQIWHAGRGSLP
jgi:hypothetical protein